MTTYCLRKLTLLIISKNGPRSMTAYYLVGLILLTSFKKRVKRCDNTKKLYYFYSAHTTRSTEFKKRLGDTKIKSKVQKMRKLKN